MLESVSLNQKRGNHTVRLFELGRIYLLKSFPVTELPNEEDRLTMAISGSSDGFEELKGITADIMNYCGVTDYKSDYSKQPFLHSGISIDVANTGYFGKVHPAISETFEVSDCYIACFNTSKLFEFFKKKSVKFIPLPKYPGIRRDIAIIVKQSVLAGDITDAIKQSAGNILESVKLFDVFQGVQVDAGYKSMAYSLFFRDTARTLVDKDSDEAVARVLRKLENDFGARLR